MNDPSDRLSEIRDRLNTNPGTDMRQEYIDICDVVAEVASWQHRPPSRIMYVDGVEQRRFEAACAAMQGMLSNIDMMKAVDAEAADSGVTPKEMLAKASVQSADALIATLDKQTV